MEEEKEKWVIDVRGHWPEMVKDSFSGDYFSDLVQGHRSVQFTGTREELDTYIEDLESQQMKVIGIMNLADTLVEFKRIETLCHTSDDIKITDVFNSQTWFVNADQAFLLAPEKDRDRISIALNQLDAPTRTFIRKSIINQWVETQNIKNK